MSEGTARKWLIISALSVFGIFWYRKWREGPTALAVDTPKFIAGWGAAYFILSLITEASPALGGSFAVVIMVSDITGNALPAKNGKGGLLNDLKDQLANKPAVGTALGGWDAALAGSGVATGAASALGTAQGAAATAGSSAAGAALSVPGSTAAPAPSKAGAAKTPFQQATGQNAPAPGSTSNNAATQAALNALAYPGGLHP